MATSNRPVSTATAVSATTENIVSAPPVNDDAGAKQADPDVRNNSELQHLLCETNKSLKDLQAQYSKTTLQLSIERLKTTSLEKDRTIFRTSCRTTANQVVKRLTQEISDLKSSIKSQEQSKQNLLKAKDIKFKDTLALYRIGTPAQGL